MLKERTDGRDRQVLRLLSETSGIGETRDPRLQRHLPLWKGCAGSRQAGATSGSGPASSLAYGSACFVLSVAFIWTLVAFGRDYILFPALAGFMIVAPFLAIGLYEKSRAIERRQGRSASARCSSCGRGPARRSSSRAAALPADAAVDAGGGAALRAVLRRHGRSLASTTSSACCSARRTAGQC